MGFGAIRVAMVPAKPFLARVYGDWGALEVAIGWLSPSGVGVSKGTREGSPPMGEGYLEWGLGKPLENDS